MDSSDESEDEHMSTEVLVHICDGSQSHPSVNRRYTHYKIRDHIKQIKYEWKGVLKATREMGKVLHKVFKTVVKDISQDLQMLGKYGSDVSYFIPYPINFSEVTRLSDDIKKP